MFYYWDEDINKPIEELGYIYTIYHDDNGSSGFTQEGPRYNIRYPDGSFDNLTKHSEITKVYNITAKIYKLLYE